MDKLVSIIVLNWNGFKYVFDCIESVLNQTYKNIEIILVDNQSTDSSIEELQKRYPRLHYVLNNSNVGFAEGMNIGLSKAKGTYVMALNMDVCLENDAIENFVNEFEKQPNVGAMMGKEFLWTDNGLIKFPTLSSGPGFLKKRGQGYFEKELIDKKTFSFGAMGSFPIFRITALKELFDVTGYYYDPKFETGWEDKDLFFRLHHLGWKFLYVPAVIGYHAGSGSVGEKHKLIDKTISYQTRIFRNRYFFIFKNYSFSLLLHHSIYLIITEFLIPIYYLFISPKSIIALVKGQLLFIIDFRKIIIDRKKIQKKSKLNYKELLFFFKKF